MKMVNPVLLAALLLFPAISFASIPFKDFSWQFVITTLTQHSYFVAWNAEVKAKQPSNDIFAAVPVKVSDEDGNVEIFGFVIDCTNGYWLIQPLGVSKILQDGNIKNADKETPVYIIASKLCR